MEFFHRLGLWGSLCFSQLESFVLLFFFHLHPLFCSTSGDCCPSFISIVGGYLPSLYFLLLNKLTLFFHTVFSLQSNVTICFYYSVLYLPVLVIAWITSFYSKFLCTIWSEILNLLYSALRETTCFILSFCSFICDLMKFSWMSILIE